MKSVRVAIIGDYNSNYISHPQTGAAILAAGRRASFDASYEWIPTDMIAAEGVGVLERFDGFWMAPGSPYASLDGALAGIRYVRESGQPFVGT